MGVDCVEFGSLQVNKLVVVDATYDCPVFEEYSLQGDTVIFIYPWVLGSNQFHIINNDMERHEFNSRIYCRKCHQMPVTERINYEINIFINLRLRLCTLNFLDRINLCCI